MAGKGNVPPETKPSKKPRLSLSLQRMNKRFSSSTAQERELIPLKSDDPAVVEVSSKQEEAWKSLFPGIRCNNCTVNVFSGQAQQPYIPPVPLSLPYYNYYSFFSVPPVSEAEGPAYQ